MKRIPDKSKQNRPKTRAVHGSPDFPARIGAWVSEEHYQLFHKNGGSLWLREVFDRILRGELK